MNEVPGRDFFYPELVKVQTCSRMLLFLLAALKPKMKSHYRGHKMAVWLNLIPQLHQPGDEDVSMRHHHFLERGEHYYSGTVNVSFHFDAFLIPYAVYG